MRGMPPPKRSPPLAWLGSMACIFWLVLLSACTQPPTIRAQALSERTLWSGRLALQVEDQATQSFSAAFELQGNAQQGELVLLNPLGNVLAKMEWTPGHARLQTGNGTRDATSLDELLQHSMGVSMPVQAFFSWLRGEQTTAAGWQADLGTIDQGRLVAHRYDPAPRATLRIAFEH